jgi:hypothetical protein
MTPPNLLATCDFESVLAFWPDASHMRLREVHSMAEPLHSLRICFRRARRMAAAPLELVLAGAIVATVAASLAYAAGWITPGPITPVTIIESLQARDGFRAGFPRAKAGCLGQVCADGDFLKSDR